MTRGAFTLAATGLAAALVGAPAATTGEPAVTAKTVEVRISGRTFPAVLSYPTRGGPYPAVAFAHGFMAPASWYAGTLRAMAAGGYVVIAPDSERGPLPSHDRLAGDLVRSLQWLARQGASGTGAVPRGKVHASRQAVAGHSMGGGVALLAAARYRSVDTVATLAAAQTSPSASAAVRRLRVPALFVVGSDDRIVPAAGTTTLFRRTRSAALLASITGGSHCGFMEAVPALCDAGRISYERQLRLTREQLRRWLDRHLAGRRSTHVTGIRGIRYTSR